MGWEGMSFGKRVVLKFCSVVGTKLAERGGARFWDAGGAKILWKQG